LKSAVKIEGKLSVPIILTIFDVKQ
jgi:hypothetical protein